MLKQNFIQANTNIGPKSCKGLRSLTYVYKIYDASSSIAICEVQKNRNEKYW